MSEPRLISPLLDNFLMGDSISAHDGVYCCPAMRCQTDDKYIVKILSIPASQTQLDALLLAGAYTSKDAALAYFRELADASVREAQLLQQLSQFPLGAHDDGPDALEGARTLSRKTVRGANLTGLRI